MFGIVLLFIKPLFDKKYGWLKLWAIVVVLGIVNTPAPSPGSIEGLIYTQLPLESHIKGAPEILVQTFLFSYFIAKPRKKRPLRHNKIALLMAFIAGIGLAVSGVILSSMLKVNVMSASKDVGAFVIMFVAMFIVFLITKWYCNKATKTKMVILALVYYLAIAILPTSYNFIANSPFKSTISLMININPVIIMLFLIYLFSNKISFQRDMVKLKLIILL